MRQPKQPLNERSYWQKWSDPKNDEQVVTRAEFKHILRIWEVTLARDITAKVAEEARWFYLKRFWRRLRLKATLWAGWLSERWLAFWSAPSSPSSVRGSTSSAPSAASSSDSSTPA